MVVQANARGRDIASFVEEAQTAILKDVKPLVTVVIGGLITSTLLTLVVLPALYRRFESDVAEED